jgi:hypothetical protein
MEPPSPAIVALIDSLVWPDPNANGSTTLDEDTLRRMQALINLLTTYIENQLELCKVE